MKKGRLPNGLIYYETTAAETCLIGGMGICDECGEHRPRGYLVPVLNHWMCSKCFEDWSKRAKHYPEDDHFELKCATYYEAMIPCENADE